MTGHEYGPHRDTDVPKVLAAPRERWGEHREVPMPDELLTQRRQINGLAHQQPEEAPMKTGTVMNVPDLPGRWSVWSKADDAPGAHFLVPADDAARAAGLKYAVVRAKQPRGAASPQLSLLRTEPDLTHTKESR